MTKPSQNFAFDNRLLVLEELIKQVRQRSSESVRQQLEQLSEDDFSASSHESGLYYSLRAEHAYFEGSYPKALEFGLKATKLLADLPLNIRYGRTLLVLAKIYWSLGDLRNAELRGRDSLAAYRRGADIEGQANAVNMLAWISFIRSDYSRATGYLEEGIVLADGDERQLAQLNGNLGRIQTLEGQWESAEINIRQALECNVKHKQETSQAINLLSLGYLHARQREFTLADQRYREAGEIIERLDLKRERALHLEYTGELALEKGDTFRAKSILGEAYHQGILLASGSSMVSQSARRLAEAELKLDNIDEAMKHAQKALEVSLTMGERVEVGASHRVIAQVFAAQNCLPEATEHIAQAIEILRQVGDPVEMARTLFQSAMIQSVSAEVSYEKVKLLFDEVVRIYKKIGLEYCQAETEFQAGVFSCQRRDLATGFKRISRAERIFSQLGEKVRVRAVNQFLQSLADQAVALSVSDENEFRIFGNAISEREAKELTVGQLEEIFQVLLTRCGGDRALIYSPDFEESPIMASFAMSAHQHTRFAENFRALLGEEISSERPTLLLDCRRDPYINDLIADCVEVTASVIVVPFKMSDQSVSYLYVERLSSDNTLNPFNQAQLNFAVGFCDVIAFKSAEMQKMKLLEDNRRLKAQLQKEAIFPNIITRNIPMREMLAQVRQVVDSNIAIAIEGETGCGKDLLARTIHYNSIRRDKRFISINCAALPETLLESELFGYKRGAFTGADRDKIGLFEEADGGTFFLDEIADMPMSIQAKILRVIEANELTRLGETTPRQVDVRILSATNKNLKDEIEARRFRHDLFYRLTALTFRLTPLRERKEDIPLLVTHFLKESGKSVSSEVMKYLVSYDWPGNVRELDNEIKKLVLLASDNDELTADVLSSKVLASRGVDSVSEGFPGQGHPSLHDSVEFNETYSLYDYLSEQEKHHIIKALRERKMVKKHAASALNIPESTLRLKIKQYGIDLRDLDTLH